MRSRASGRLRKMRRRREENAHPLLETEAQELSHPRCRVSETRPTTEISRAYKRRGLSVIGVLRFQTMAAKHAELGRVELRALVGKPVTEFLAKFGIMRPDVAELRFAAYTPAPKLSDPLQHMLSD